jgi:hypothetical protein
MKAAMIIASAARALASAAAAALEPCGVGTHKAVEALIKLEAREARKVETLMAPGVRIRSSPAGSPAMKNGDAGPLLF